jgi:glycosyltransferase involved in cell wall biosynthesis
MRVVIASVQVPFVRGGAEFLAEGLLRAIVAAGHTAEIVTVPFRDGPQESTRMLDQAIACRLLDLTYAGGTSIDRLIGLKFPAYLIPHTNKVLWILHQYRSVYDQWDNQHGLSRSPSGLMLRNTIRRMDSALLPESREIFTISKRVSERLMQYCGINSEPLYPPLAQPDLFYSSSDEGYLFYPSRIGPSKRQNLVLHALAKTRSDVKIVFAGSPETAADGVVFEQTLRSLGLEHRVTSLGWVSEQAKADLYARCLGVVFAPLDEDYGYITLEAMQSSKPVLTCSDSGGPLEFVIDGLTGRIVDASADALAEAMDQAWSDRPQMARWGTAGRERLDSFGLSWATVVERLLR